MTGYVPTLVALSLLALPTPDSRDKDKHIAHFGGLVITVTALEDVEGNSDRHYIAVYVGVKNTGKQPACASFSAKLKTTYALEYRSTLLWYGPRKLPDTPRIREMLPGEESSGAYVFNVKDGVKPLELTLKREGKTIRCAAAGDGGWGDMFLPEEIHFDVRDLPQKPE